MSRLRTIAECMKDRLEEIPELAGKVVIYRRSDIESEFQKRMEKAKGKAVVIRLISGKNESQGKAKARFSGSYTVTLFTVPVLTQGDAKDADSLMDEITAKIQGWWPPSVPSNGTIYLQTGALTFPDDADYDVSNLTVTTS